MARLIGFQQETGAPNGAGTFHFEDGSSTYAYSPDDAAPFLAGVQQPAPEPDQRLAMSDPAAAYKTAAWQQAQGGVTIPDESAYVAPGGVSVPEASDVGGMSGGYSPAPPEPQGGMSPPTAPVGYGIDPSKLPVDTSPPPAPRPQPRPAAPQAQPQGQPAAGAPAPRGQGPDPALAPYGAAPRGMQAKDMTVQYQEAGLPYSEADAAARQKAAMGQAEVKGRWVEVERAQQQAAYLDALDKKNAAKEQIQQRQAKIEGIRKSYRQQRAAVQEEVNAAAQEKVDPDRFFTDRGPLARIGAAIAQAMGAYAAILGKSPNFAQEIIDKEINRDIAAQRDNIAKHGAEAKNKLGQLMQDYGLDIDEASNMLRASQQQLAESTVAAYASQSKDIELQKNYEEWLAQRAIDRQKEEEGYERESIGKRSGTVKFGRVDAGGAGGVPKVLQGVFPSAAHMKAARMAYEKDEVAAGREPTDAGFIAKYVNVGKGNDGSSGDGERVLGQRLGVAVAKGETAIKRFDRVAQLTGLEKDEDGVHFKVPGIGEGLAGEAKGYWNKLTRTAGSKAAAMAKDQAAEGMAIVLAGGSDPKPEQREMAHKMVDTMNPRDIAIRANEAIDEARDFKANAEKYGSRSVKSHGGSFADERDE